MKTIIFVCHGSICRSPACEYIAKSLSSSYQFISRAISHEEIGNDIYPPMKAALTRTCIPFSRHYATYLSKEDVIGAETIYYMDESNRRRLCLAYPEYQEKFKPVSLYTDSLNEIEDPWYTGAYDKVVMELRLCVSEMIKRLS